MTFATTADNDVAAAAAQVPALSEWVLLLLAGLLGAVAMRRA